MQLRVRDWIFIALDITCVAFLGYVINEMITGEHDAKQIFAIVYIYFMFVIFYLSIRLRFVAQQTWVFRVHIFNFLYSLFTIITGYLELIKSLSDDAGDGLLKTSPVLFVFNMIALVLAHVVFAMYLCCWQIPYARRRSTNPDAPQSDANKFLKFEQLNLRTEKFDNKKMKNDSLCSI